MASVAIVGAGPAGLMAAEVISDAGHDVTIFEKMPSPARKFLMAGLGGLNITHEGTLEELTDGYFYLPPELKKAIEAFPHEALGAWVEELGQPVFVGSSGKIFPQCFKTSPLLRSWLRRLEQSNVQLLTRHTWTGFGDNSELTFETGDGVSVRHSFDAVVFTMGGASWPRLGSNGEWLAHLDKLVDVAPFKPSNMGINIAWSDYLKSKFAGAPIKSIELNCENQTVAGELLLTSYGLEGSAIYAMSAFLRDQLSQGDTQVFIDMRPGQSEEALAARLEKVPAKQSLSNCLRRALKFTSVETALVYEAGPPPSDSHALARLVKHLPLVANGIQGLDRAISSAGGVEAHSLTENFMFKDRPGFFAAGEMLNFDAPTGGYLLQACMSSGRQAGQGVVHFLAQPDDRLT